MFKKSSLILFFLLSMGSASLFAEPLNSGPWRFELSTNYGKVPFIIEFKPEKKKTIGLLKNGKETIRLEDIKVNKEKILIPLQNYEMTLELSPPDQGKMSGWLLRENKNPVVKMPVVAVYKETERFPGEKKKPKIDLNGRWAVEIVDEDGKKEPGVIIFKQEKNALSGSILTTTGDFRYMEGYVSGDEFEAASFDGVYNYLVKGNVKNNVLEAKVLTQYKLNVKGKKDPKAKLPDAYAQTKLEKGLSFSFPDLSGRRVSLKDDRYKNRPVIVTFFGSWCPNCIDEMNFLIPWYNENRERGIEIIALAFERSLTPQAARAQLLKTRKQKDIPYALLHAGSTSEDKPKNMIPGLKNFISFPTTVFLDKNHRVYKVHAGFNGPSTGEFYKQWIKEFEQTVDELLK